MARVNASSRSYGSSRGLRIPVLGNRLRAPARGSLAWYAGLGAMTALEVVEWPLALAVAASHAIATHARNPEVREFAEGTEEGEA